ncbi:HopJ type III effector protein [Marinomonas sp. C2222]|uniref:HopJ type III effector protein n=1 Tax=Marinomonas sargassi TaxID=2984494 RepID=A0ABT2YQI7_9GAMM|nr:HopJ type III effector protein [Marinomonas sargassi]MCV2402154.1 HopJ type III effector protein [Marinomonas sargassi]
MLNSQTLIDTLKQNPTSVQFKDVISVIENEYEFTPTSFTNGNQANAANENNGSCKIFSFAAVHQLAESETLQLFGDFYRVDVLQNPEASDHQNIRQFMIHGWSGIKFESIALTPKS